jgi:hypothetical protein
MYQSIVQKRGEVQFPEFMAERVYMQKFFKNEGLPESLKRWQPTVNSMLAGIETEQPIYLMVDQAFVPGGNAHRRPGKHVDGYWVESVHRGNGHGGHRISAHGIHGPKHAPTRKEGEHAPRHSAGLNGWDAVDFSYPEGIILASDIQACAAYNGLYDESLLGEGGDASHISGHFERIDMQSNHVYAGNVGMLHESLPVNTDCFRTVVRLNVPGWSPLH